MKSLCKTLLIAILTLVPAAVAALPQTILTLNSQPGDYIGQGMFQTFTPADGTFTATTTFSNGVQVSFHTANFSSNWSLSFGPPTASKLMKTEYEGAQRFAFHAPPKPGIDVSGDGRGCNTDVGRFLVSDLAFAKDGTILRLAIDFEQHCEGATPALYGSVRFNSSVSTVARVSAGAATTLKGNVGTSDASMTVSLSEPSSQLVTVNYATADGSAVQGTDYVNMSGTVQFQPGTTSQTVSVPIIGNRLARGNKTFHMQLSAPNGAPLGAGRSNVRILDPNVPLTALVFNSQQGDYIGQGQLQLFTIADGTFTTSRNFDNGVSVAVRTMDSWNLDLAGPTKSTLTVGAYENAQRFPFQPTGVPGLDFSGAGRGCNTSTGRFDVLQAVYAADGSVRKFRADFEQHCEGAVPALFGWLVINTPLRQISVSDAMIVGSSAMFMVTLNTPSSTATATVDFATVDGTAIAGTDYVATSQTVTFAPGESAHVVTVPLLTSGGGKKEFFGRLASPTGTPVWVSQGSAKF